MDGHVKSAASTFDRTRVPNQLPGHAFNVYQTNQPSITTERAGEGGVSLGTPSCISISFLNHCE